MSYETVDAIGVSTSGKIGGCSGGCGGGAVEEDEPPYCVRFGGCDACDLGRAGGCGGGFGDALLLLDCIGDRVCESRECMGVRVLCVETGVTMIVSAIL